MHISSISILSFFLASILGRSRVCPHVLCSTASTDTATVPIKACRVRMAIFHVDDNAASDFVQYQVKGCGQFGGFGRLDGGQGYWAAECRLVLV